MQDTYKGIQFVTAGGIHNDWVALAISWDIAMFEETPIASSKRGGNGADDCEMVHKGGDQYSSGREGVDLRIPKKLPEVVDPPKFVVTVRYTS